jgi:hypothetical protein
VGVYSDASGASTLLGAGPLQSPKADAWNVVTISPANIVSGGVYWLAVLGVGPSGSGNIIGFKSADQGGPAFGYVGTLGSDLPMMWMTDNKDYHAAPLGAYLAP